MVTSCTSRLCEASDDDEGDDADVEEGEDVVEPGGLLDPYAQHQRQQKGDCKRCPV